MKKLIAVLLLALTSNIAIAQPEPFLKDGHLMVPSLELDIPDVPSGLLPDQGLRLVNGETEFEWVVIVDANLSFHITVVTYDHKAFLEKKNPWKTGNIVIHLLQEQLETRSI